MEYQKKYNRKKVQMGLTVSVLLIAVVVLIGYWMGPGMVTTQPDKTPPPYSTLSPIEGELAILDPALENAIKKQLSLSESVTKADVESLTVLEYTDEAIKDLTGLEFAINLKELKLNLEAYTIDPIKELHLEKLTVVSRVSVQPLLKDIKELPYLKYLDLTNCGISTVGYLSELPLLETLILDNNRPANIEYLMKIKTLSTLSMKNCGIKSINALENNISIRTLYIDNNKIEDISVLETMKSLKTVSYEGNNIKPTENNNEE